MAERIVVYTTTSCPYCQRAKVLLEKKRLPFVSVDVTDDPERRQWLVKVTGLRTVPQIFIDGQPVGGFDALARLERSGELDRLWSRSSPQTRPHPEDESLG